MELVCGLIELTFKPVVTVLDLIPYIDTRFLALVVQLYRPSTEDLALAIENNSFPLILFLLSTGRFSSQECLMLAIRQNRSQIVELLLQHKLADPSLHKNDALSVAAYHSHDKIVKILLKDKRVDPKDVLLWTLDDAKITQLILGDKRINSRVLIGEAFIKASSRGKHLTVEVFLKERCIEAFTLREALYAAASQGHHLVVELLLQNERIKLDDVDLALNVATHYGRQNVIDLILQYKQKGKSKCIIQ